MPAKLPTTTAALTTSTGAIVTDGNEAGEDVIADAAGFSGSTSLAVGLPESAARGSVGLEEDEATVSPNRKSKRKSGSSKRPVEDLNSIKKYLSKT